MKKKNSKIITYLLILLIITVIAVVSYLVFVSLKEKNTKDTYTQAANEFEKIVSKGKKSKGENATLTPVSSVESSDDQYLEGYEIIGTIEIPKVDLKCPILSEVTTRSIEIAVGLMYSTGGLNQPGNSVIYGHNYRNTLFFSRNDELEIDDEIIILDKTGEKKRYKIFNIFETTMTDTSFYSRTAEITEGKAEVTLSTCTDDAAETDRRLIIQASEI